jgi:hypothetical protein
VLDVTSDCCRYLPVAQNGFVNLPSQLKIDTGYFGSGFYFTRYPRWRRAAFVNSTAGCGSC